MSVDQGAAMAMVIAADLGCALCRKRTGEAVTRLCHACGLPVHLSCAQHVAARECELEFGFPLPAVYCSKRCYDTAELLVPTTTTTATTSTSAPNDDDLSTTALAAAGGGKRWSPQVPNEVTAALTLKIGDVSRTSRKHLSITTFRFLLSEGFDVFKAKVNSRAAKELQQHTLEAYVREDPAVYIRPGVHSKQAELVELTDQNFETRIRKTFRNFLKRKATQSDAGRQEQFECDIYAYVKKESAVRRRRDSHTSAGASSAVMDGRGGTSGGGGVKMLSGLAAQHHLMLQQQQQTLLGTGGGTFDDAVVGEAGGGSSALLGGSVGGKRRLSDLHERSDEVVDAGGTPPGYKSIRMVLNGSVVAVKVNVGDLLSALGLPPTGFQTTLGTQSDNEGGTASGSSVNGEC